MTATELAIEMLEEIAKRAKAASNACLRGNSQGAEELVRDLAETVPQMIERLKAHTE